MRVINCIYEALPAMPRPSFGRVVGGLVGTGFGIAAIYENEVIRSLYYRDVVACISAEAYSVLVILALFMMMMRRGDRGAFFRWMIMTSSIVIGSYTLVSKVSG